MGALGRNRRCWWSTKWKRWRLVTVGIWWEIYMVYIYICMVNKWIIYQYIKQCIYIYTGWWFQTWLLFSIIGNFIIPSDEVPHFSE
jgi:hypothetical protein